MISYFELYFNCDALEHIAFVMSLFFPNDVPPQIANRCQMEAMPTHTTKPVIFVSYDLAGCRDAVTMAEIVTDGATALRERPLVAGYVNPTTGLLHNAEALQKLLLLAERAAGRVEELLVSHQPEPLAGATAQALRVVVERARKG